MLMGLPFQRGGEGHRLPTGTQALVTSRRGEVVGRGAQRA